MKELYSLWYFLDAVLKEENFLMSHFNILFTTKMYWLVESNINQ